MQKDIRVVAALLEKQGAVLVQQRPAHKAQGLLWEFPGGKVEPRESDAQALERECREELGITVAVGELYWQTQHTYDTTCVTLLLYRCQQTDDAPPQAHEAAALAYVPHAELVRLPFCPADEPVIQKLAGKHADNVGAAHSKLGAEEDGPSS